MTTMVVLVNLREGVSPEDYESWVKESYAPAVKTLPSVRDWRAYHVGGLLASDNTPPYRYVVIVASATSRSWDGIWRLRRRGGLLSELHRLAEVVQLVSERLV